MSIGFAREEVPFYSVELNSIFEAEAGVESEFIFQLGAFESMYTREIYTLWDFASDVGGLQAGLYFACSFFMFLFNTYAGSALERYLVSNLFKVKEKKKDENKEYINNRLAWRKPAIFTACNCFARWKDSITPRVYVVAE